MGQKIRESEVIGANDSGFYLKNNAFMHKWVRVGELIRYNIENKKRPGLFISFGFVIGPDSFFVNKDLEERAYLQGYSGGDLECYLLDEAEVTRYFEVELAKRKIRKGSVVIQPGTTKEIEIIDNELKVEGSTVKLGSVEVFSDGSFCEYVKDVTIKMTQKEALEQIFKKLYDYEIEIVK